MASLAVYAERFPPDRFATLTGLQIGVGTVGTLIATAPLAFSTATIGWRASFLAVAAFTFVLGLLLAAVIKGGVAPSAGHRIESFRESLSGIFAVMRTPSVGRLFVMNLVMYSSFALIAGLWGGPYLTHIYGYGLEERGNLLLVPVLGQIVGAMLWGATDRLAGSHKPPVLIGAGPPTALLLGYLALVAHADHAGSVARRLWPGIRLFPGADRPWQGDVCAPSGRPRPHRPNIAHGRVFLVRYQRICDRVFPTAQMAPMRLTPIGWCSGCRLALSYWPVWLILAHATPCRSPSEPMQAASRGSPVLFCIGRCAGAWKRVNTLLFLLRFVRRCILLRAVAPRVTAALLGRFPRLGPLAFAGGPFLCVIRRRYSAAARYGRSSLDQECSKAIRRFQIGSQAMKDGERRSAAHPCRIRD